MKPLARTNDLMIEELGSERVVYDTQTKKAHTLNSSVAWVWQRCDGQTSIEQIASSFEREFKVENGLEVVASALNQLSSAGLLDQPVTPVLTRRAVVAAGSALAPVVASVLVPTAQAAKSGGKIDGGGGGGKDKGPKDKGGKKGR